ncbi:hypothetical protein F-VV57_0479 [Faustovirus]|nr:hypothetical protein F-VV57_0479 [Faustovirus]QJX73747.1 hypothetical protein F-VV63_0481 [Faustovirus]
MSHIPLELVIEMGKYDIWLYQKIRMLSKRCHRELKNYNPVQDDNTIGDERLLRKHSVYKGTLAPYKMAHTHHIYCPTRRLGATGLVADARCRYEIGRMWECKHYIKRVIQYSNEAHRQIEYRTDTQTIILEFDVYGRMFQRRVYKTDNSSRYCSVECIEYIWPQTGRVYKRYEGFASASRELYRPDGTLKCIETHISKFNITRDWYDKTGQNLVAHCTYVIDERHRYKCTQVTIQSGWH